MRKIKFLVTLICASVISISAHAQATGKVTDAKDGSPLAGATIKVRGENTNAISKTDGTFDCSSALSIPSLSYRSHLPASGVTEVEVPAQKIGTDLKGICAMGMYNFSVKFN